MPTVGLLVPCYNAAPYLARLWQSIAAQAIAFDEMIFYDDASTDDTADRIDALPGVRLLRGERNLGAGNARNLLAQAAMAEFIHFHDADDPMLPRFIEQMKPLLAEDVDVALCDADWISERDGSLVRAWRYPDAQFSADAVEAALTNPVGLNASIMRRSCFLEAGGFDPELKIFEDGDIHVRLAAAGARFRSLGQVAATSIRHDRGITSNQTEIPRYHLLCLAKYAATLDARYRPVLAREVESCAHAFLVHGDREGMREALALCRSLGGDPPQTRNPALRAIRSLAGRDAAFVMQHRLRHSLKRLGRRFPMETKST